MPMDLILHYPSERETETIEDVVSFEVEYDDENTVRAETDNHEYVTRTATGLTVMGGSEPEPRESEEEGESFHYFYDSAGHLYVDMTAVRQSGRIDLVPLGGGEVSVRASTVRVSKTHPVLSLPITADSEDGLERYFGDDNQGNADVQSD